MLNMLYVYHGVVPAGRLTAAGATLSFQYDNTYLRTGLPLSRAYSDPKRPLFRPESGRHSDGKAATIPVNPASC